MQTHIHTSITGGPPWPRSPLSSPAWPFISSPEGLLVHIFLSCPKPPTPSSSSSLSASDLRSYFTSCLLGCRYPEPAFLSLPSKDAPLRRQSLCCTVHPTPRVYSRTSLQYLGPFLQKKNLLLLFCSILNHSYQHAIISPTCNNVFC